MLKSSGDYALLTKVEHRADRLLSREWEIIMFSFRGGIEAKVSRKHNQDWDSE